MNFKEVLEIAVKYYKENLQVRVRESLRIAVHAFIESLWECMKDVILDSARKSLELIRVIWQSAEVKEKKKAIIEVIMLRIKLPLVARPFKGLIKKMISNKVDDIVEDLLGKGFQALG